MPQTIDAIVFTAPHQVEIQSFELPPCGPNQLVVRSIYTLVSSGTELRVLGGHYGAAGNYPLIPGYIVIGEVIEVGAEAHGWKVGDLISGRNPVKVPGINSQWGGQASHHLYETSGADMPVLLPAGANPLDYIIAEIGAICWKGAEAANPQPGETAIVIGQGLIGALSAAWIQSRGCRVVAVDVADSRLQRALDRGASAVVNARDPHALERLKALVPGGAPLVVEASGSTPGLKLAFQLVRPQNSLGGNTAWPRLLLQANYLEEVPLNPFSFFPGEGVVLLAPMDRGITDRQKVVEFLRNGTLKSEPFIDQVLSYKEAPAAYERLFKHPDQFFSLIYDWTK
jgi:2-desacetyl-2-hydroxyethyl bacteriochlorophyllide A dehydrogenase